MPVEVTTVADDLAVLHTDGTAHVFEELAPDTEYELLGTPVRTLPSPGGELLCTFATVNDVHFGEVECGRLDDSPGGPILRAPDGAPPYPETMNRAAIGEITATDPVLVVVKGDLTADGGPEEFAAFEATYRPAFGDRLRVIRGNHDAYRMQTEYAGDQIEDLPGVRLVLLDTVIPGATTGRVTPEQVALVEDAAAGTSAPVLVLGHHQSWVSGKRDPGYFGIDPDSSDALSAAFARHANLRGYLAGHTHRNRVRPVQGAPGAVTVEVGCVKDFPGSWAQYRVYEGGILQVHRRISTPEALAWSEQCRVLYRDFGLDYTTYAMGALSDRCFAFPDRAA